MVSGDKNQFRNVIFRIRVHRHTHGQKCSFPSSEQQPCGLNLLYFMNPVMCLRAARQQCSEDDTNQPLV